MILTCITPPVREPVTLDQVKKFLKIDDDQEDSLLQDISKAARQFVEDYTGQSLLEQRWQLQLFPAPYFRSPLLTLTRPCRSEVRLRLPKVPVITIEQVHVQYNYGPMRMLKDTEYNLYTDSFYGQLSIHPLGVAIRQIKVIYTAGCGKDHSQVPPLFIQAVLMKCAELYENRGDQPRSNNTLSATEQLLKPYRACHFGLNYLNQL